ncbi:MULTISPECIES: methyltransferase domain-containing protein [Rhodomicrobium]|uniref:methyltransferase domain-containing protein n=1 Tax=Rhodomicrobium TaxID=1068 RepID=UPI000B4B491D|nr:MULTISPECIES: methyltransferase domain-containing protein [Rhodomicrobium]
MRPDVSELSEFYRGPLGAVARRLLAHRIRSVWPNVCADAVLGIGYAAPFMRPFRNEARRLLLAMPEEQGAVRWPEEGPVCSFLANETELPLADASVDRVLAVHCLEHSGSARPLLREIWRVLAPEGRLLLVVPNRRGLWARIDSTPFGYGHPFSRGQLERLLADCLYSATGWWPSLFMPPVNRPIVLNTAVAWERIGSYAWPAFSGVMIVEAQKQIYAPIAKPAKAKRQAVPARVPHGEVVPG